MRCTLFLSIALALQVTATATAAEPTRPAADAIASQPLDMALNALSRQTGLQFVYNAQVAGNPRTPAVPAGLSAEAALDRLLAGTGLRYRYLNAESEVSVRMSLFGRRVELERGQASFVVAPDRRPFAVHAGGLQVTDIGTTFDVSLLRRRHIALALQRMPVRGGLGQGGGMQRRFTHRATSRSAIARRHTASPRTTCFFTMCEETPSRSAICL